MGPAAYPDQASVPPPAYHRSLAHALHLDALTLVQRLRLLALCQLAVHLAQQQYPPPLPAGPGGAPRIYSEESLLLVALLRTLWRLSSQEVHDWLCAWPALALACGLPQGADDLPRVPSKSQQSKRLRAAGAPSSELLFVLLVRAGLWMGLTRARDLIIDSAPILARRRADPDAAFGHAPAHHPRPLLLGYRLPTLLCRGTGLPLLFLLSPANVHDAPFARPLLELAVRLFALRPRVVRLDAGYWGLKLIAWIHTVLGAQAVIPWKSQAAEATGRAPAHLDGGGVGQTHQHRALFRARLGLLPLAAPTGLWLVGGGNASRAHLRGGLGYCFGCLASRTARTHPISTPRPGSCLGRSRVVKRPQLLPNTTASVRMKVRMTVAQSLCIVVASCGGIRIFG
ncbi:MAG TPA: transposase [Ktedonobacterales bacterium]|nr:transposase [Ktedonobacterales bacterium]